MSNITITGPHSSLHLLIAISHYRTYVLRRRCYYYLSPQLMLIYTEVQYFYA